MVNGQKSDYFPIEEQLATLSHVMLSCPVFQAVRHSTWTAVTQQLAPPPHADLLLADDRRGPWQPPGCCSGGSIVTHIVCHL